MRNSAKQSFIQFFSVLVLCSNTALSLTCNPSSCVSGAMGPQVRFPFRLKDRQDQRCGYPGFDLECNSFGQTILKLPKSGDFVVTQIDYASQTIYINDPEFCLADRIQNFTTSGSSFRGVYTRNYTILECSLDATEYVNKYQVLPIFCFNRQNRTVLAMPSPAEIPQSCRRTSTVSIPLDWVTAQYWSSTLFREDFQLGWSEPRCRGCESQGGVCGFKSDAGNEVACLSPPNRGLPRTAKYGIIIGGGIPALLCLIGLACYTAGKVKALGQRSRQSSELPTITIPQRLVSTGLDGPTIASYPKIVLGESKRLPKPNDGTCPICLSDYEPKEILRTIPECNHYFHADCIDEWLRLNVTCPLCRKTPDSSAVTPCSSVLSSSTSSSTSS